MTEGGEFGAGFLIQAHLDPRQDLGGAGWWRFAAARAAKNPALNPVAAGEHGQHEVAVAKGMVVQDQRVVVNDRHRHIVSEADVGPLTE